MGSSGGLGLDEEAHRGSTAIEVLPPPRLPESVPLSGSMGMLLMPAASGVGSVLLAVTHQDRPLLAAAGLVVLAASIAVGVVMVIGSRTGARRRTREQRERYLDYLEQVRSSVREAAARQHATTVDRHRDPRVAAGQVQIPPRLNNPDRRGLRHPGDSEFLVLRVGVGVAPLVPPIILRADPNDPLTAYDPVCLAAAQDLAARYSTLDDQPLCVAMAQVPILTITGPAARVRELIRALLAQVISAHDPADVAVLICSGDHRAWDWIKWVPHTRSEHLHDGPSTMRLITDNPAETVRIVAAETGTPQLRVEPRTRRMIVVVDSLHDATPMAAKTAAGLRELGAQQIHLVEHGRSEPPTDVRVTLGPPEREGDLIQKLTTNSEGRAQPALAFRADSLSPPEITMLARTFAPLLATTSALPFSDNGTADPLWSDGAAVDPARIWQQRAATDLLRVAIGHSEGSPLLIDLKESARGGMGPHGLVVGATGSGKSELLRSLVAALAVSHPPESLALLLADFKGGATFSGFGDLPHLAGMITNLEADLSLVDRFRDALSGELQRRQELLAAAGKLTSLDAYVQLRRRQPDLEPVPRLLVIIDEFSELLSARPDLAELFVAIGRIGRSIGVHLLLATQRLDTGRIRGLESHLSYRMCLRTFSEAESREAIGTPDAYHLPAEPGWAFLRADGPELRRFRSIMVTRAFQPAPQERRRMLPVLPFTAVNGISRRIDELQSRRAGPGPELPSEDATAPGHRPPTVLDVTIRTVIDRAKQLPEGRPARRIWLEPLPSRVTLGELPDHSPSGKFDNPCVPIGLVDLPERQRQDVLQWDFSQGNGNLLIVGTGRSGKSTAAATLLVSLAHHRSPGDLHLFCVDFGGERLLPFADLPHVVAMACRSEPDLIRSIFSTLEAMLTERAALFRRHRLSTVSALRSARSTGAISSSVPSDVIVIVDGWAGLQEADPTTDRTMDEILTRGPGLGVHTILTIAAVNQLRTRLAGGFGGRIELRLNDSFDSAIDRQLAKALPVNVPGRALVAGRHYAQLAMPILDALHRDSPNGTAIDVDDKDAEDADARIVEAVQARWPGRAAPRLRVLPALVRLDELIESSDERVGEQSQRANHELPEDWLVNPGIPAIQIEPFILGMAERDLHPVRLDVLTDDAHLLIYGDSGTGKTTALRSLLAQLSSRPGSTDLRSVNAGNGRSPVGQEIPARSAIEIVVVDYRRGIRVRQPLARQFWVAGSAQEVATACSAIVSELSRRQTEVAQPAEPRVTDPSADNERLGTARTDNEPAPRSEIFVLVDDYDLVCSGGVNPLSPLIPFLPYGRDIGFHLMVARRTGGAARAQYEALLQTLGDLGTPVVMLSGPPSEGRLAHGLVPQVLPVGRAQFAGRRIKTTVVQTAWVPR